MKIAILSYGHLDQILPLFKRLRKKVNVKLIMIFSQDAKLESLLNFNDLQVKDGFVNNEQKNNILSRIGMEGYITDIEIFIFHNNRIRSIINTLLYFRLKNKLKHYDLIHFNGQHVTLIPLLLLLPNRIKKVFTVHDFKPHSGEGGKYKMYNCYWRNNLLLKRFSWPMVIQNRYDYDIIKKDYPKVSRRLIYIPFGKFESYKQWLNPEIREEIYDVIFFGRISPYKGIGYLLKAILLLQAENKQLLACIAGSGNMDQYVDLVNKTRNVKIINRYIKSAELVQLIQKSRIVICPYTDATQSGVAMTAFALNKPVIASKIGGLDDAIENGINGLLVEPENAKELAEKIEYLVTNENERKHMVNNIANNLGMSDFDWNDITDAYINLYERIIYQQ